MNTPTPQHSIPEQERELLLRNVLNAVSHDLKTPLACIIGSLEIFERSKDKLSAEKAQVLLNTALKEAYRLDGFISNILDMAKLETGSVKVRKEQCILGEVLADCMTTMEERLRGCDVHITAPDAPVSMNTDPTLLARAICIVLDNAAKYCTDTIIIDINVDYNKVAHCVTIHIQDNGPGIPTAQLETVFSKYTRLALGDHQQAGTGLGLPICRMIMDLLGGQIHASNRPDHHGAIFTLSFTA